MTTDMVAANRAVTAYRIIRDAILGTKSDIRAATGVHEARYQMRVIDAAGRQLALDIMAAAGREEIEPAFVPAAGWAVWANDFVEMMTGEDHWVMRDARNAAGPSTSLDGYREAAILGTARALAEGVL